MKRMILTIYICLGLFTQVNAENLLQIYNLALNNDAQFRAETSNYYAVKQQHPQTRAALLPQLSGTISSSENTSDVKGSTFFGAGDSSTYSYSIDLNQSLYNHGHWQRLKQANLNVAQAEANYSAAKQNLILRVAEAYFNLLAAEDNLKFSEAEKHSVGRQLEQTKQRFEVGLIAITDVKESQSQYDQAIAAEIQAANTLDATREALWTLTNTDVENLVPLGKNLPLLMPEPNNKQLWVEQALANNLKLISTGFARDAANKEISIQRSEHYPSLNLTAQERFQDLDYDDVAVEASLGREQTDTNIGIHLSVPLFSGGATHARVKEAVYRHDAARDEYELTRRRTIQETRNAYQNTIADISRVKALKQALISSQAAYEATEAGFEVGTRNSVDVLISLRNTFRAERNYAQTRYDYLLNTLKLKQAAGNLTMADIAAITRWLN